MPHELIRAKGHSRERSLGWLANAWIEALTLHGRGDARGMPVVHTDEYYAFVLDCYALDERGNRLYDNAMCSRSKGTDKSGLAARIAMFEALGPCRFDHWAEEGEVYVDPWGLGFEYRFRKGEPVGHRVNNAVIELYATEEGQTGNIMDTVRFNFDPSENGILKTVLTRKDDCQLSQILLPDGGIIKAATSSASSKDGRLPTFIAADETHLMIQKGLKAMYHTASRNLTKRKATAGGTWLLEVSTMCAMGEGSVAEDTYRLADLIKEGKAKRDRLLMDHRYGDISPEDLADEDKARAALIEAYGDAIAWNSIEDLLNGVLDSRNGVGDSLRYWFNSRDNTAEDQWIAAHEWNACGPVALDPPPPPISPTDAIALGFDGSRRRRGRGATTDATALIGCRISDGCLFEVAVWEQPPNYAGSEGWEVPVAEVDAAVLEVFKKFNVVGFYADPALWETNVAQWEAKFNKHLKIKASTAHPIEFWMLGGSAWRTIEALRQFRDAVLDGDLRHDGSPTLTRHVLNARTTSTNKGLSVRKRTPDSPHKIDAAVAAVLAWQCRLDAIAKGVGVKKSKRTVARIR